MIIVTGGAGFIGSAIVWKLNQLGHEDILIVDHLGTSVKWRNLVPLRYTDYMNKAQFIQEVREDGLPEDTEVVIHMGACSSTTERDQDYLMENNFHYSRDLADICLEEGVRFVHASSAATYGDGSQGYSDDAEELESLRPLNGYGYSKHLFDLWLKREGLLEEVVGFKFFNVFGPNEYHKGEMRSMVLKAYEQIQETGRVKLFANHREGYRDGDEERDFVYVKDVVESVVHAVEHPSLGGVFNLGTGKARSFRDLVHAVFSALDREPDIEWIPMPSELRGQYQYFTQADMQRLDEAGAPVPSTSLEDAVSDYVRNYMVEGMARLEP